MKQKYNRRLSNIKNGLGLVTEDNHHCYHIVVRPTGCKVIVSQALSQDPTNAETSK